MSKQSLILMADSTGTEVTRTLASLNQLEGVTAFDVVCVAPAHLRLPQKWPKLQDNCIIHYYQSLSDLAPRPEPPFIKLVSFLLATRGRPHNLLNAIGQLYHKTTDKTCLELLLGIDHDDGDTLAILNQLPTDVDIKIVIRPRGKGYDELYQLLNQLMHLACGEFGFFYTDDALMQTADWDSCLKKYRGHFGSFNPDTETPNNVYPIVSKRLFHVLGHLALHAFADSWLEEVLGLLKLEQPLPEIKVLHDTTQNEGHFSVENAMSFYSHEISYAKYQDIRTILTYIESYLRDKPAHKGEVEYAYLRNIYCDFYGLNPAGNELRWCASQVSIHLFRIVLNQYCPTEKRLSLADVEQGDFFQLSVNEILAFYIAVNELGKAEDDPGINHGIERLEQIQHNFQRLLGQRPTHLLTWYYLALINLALNHSSAVLACCRQFVELIENGPFEVLLKLFDIMTPLGVPFLILEWDQLRFQEMTVQEQKKTCIRLLTWQILQLQGQIHDQMGNDASARQAYQKALALRPDCKQTQMHLMKMDLKQKQQHPLIFDYLTREESFWAAIWPTLEQERDPTG